MELTIILQKVLEIGGSDLFLIPGSPATAKVKGHLVPLTESKLLPEDAAGMIKEAYGMAGGHSDEMLRRDGDGDFSFSLNRQARFRCNAYKQRGTLAATCRVVTFGLPNPDALHIPPMVIDLASSCRNGMVLVTGPAGSGKSTTLACMVDRINADQDVHIITIEDPIEYVYESKQSLIHQREVGEDIVDFASAIRSALREDPDVILVGEMRDYETISTALLAAETGHLVLSTLHTTGAAQTVERIVDACPRSEPGACPACRNLKRHRQPVPDPVRRWGSTRGSNRTACRHRCHPEPDPRRKNASDSGDDAERKQQRYAHVEYGSVKTCATGIYHKR